MGQRIHFDLDLIHESTRRGRVIQRAFLKGFGQGFQRGERRAKLVREIADKIPAHGFQAAQAGEVLNEQKASAGVLIGNDNELQILMARGHFDRLALHLTRLLAAPPGFDKLVVAHNFDNAVVDGIGKLKEPARSRVGKLDESLLHRRSAHHR